MTSARWATSSVQKENVCVCQGGMENNSFVSRLKNSTSGKTTNLSSNISN
jgi:hypothetical protein